MKEMYFFENQARKRVYEKVSEDMEKIRNAYEIRIQRELESALIAMRAYKYINSSGRVMFNVPYELFREFLNAVTFVKITNEYIYTHIDEIRRNKDADTAKLHTALQMASNIDISYCKYLQALLNSSPIWDERKEKEP